MPAWPGNYATDVAACTHISDVISCSAYPKSPSFHEKIGVFVILSHSPIYAYSEFSILFRKAIFAGVAQVSFQWLLYSGRFWAPCLVPYHSSFVLSIWMSFSSEAASLVVLCKWWRLFILCYWKDGDYWLLLTFRACGPLTGVGKWFSSVYRSYTLMRGESFCVLEEK